MYDTLLVKIEKSLEDLRHVEGDEVLWKFAEVFADAVQRAVFAVPGRVNKVFETTTKGKQGLTLE
jgi:hypothetical protein